MTDFHYVYFSTTQSRNDECFFGASAGPLEMHAALHKDKNKQIYFWCYDSDVSFFQDYFKNKVTVMGCRNHLETALENYRRMNDKHLAWIIERLLKVLNTSENGLFVDTFFMKNIFSFYILHTQGGYVLDVSLFPFGEVNFPNFHNYKIVNLIDKFNFQEVIHIIPNRKIFSDTCIAVTSFPSYTRESEYKSEHFWLDTFNKLEIFDSIYYKNHEELDFRKDIVGLNVLDCWAQYARATDPLPLYFLDYCLRVWPLLCKDRVLKKAKKLSVQSLNEFFQISHAIILSSIYNGILHKSGILNKNGFLGEVLSFLHLGSGCGNKIPEKYLLHASFQNAKRPSRSDVAVNETSKKGSYLVKELNVLKNFDHPEKLTEDGFQELNQNYVRALNVDNIMDDLKKMEWWWQS